MKNQVEIDSVTKYFGDKCVLDQFSLIAEEGEFVVILGPSGCGKSTLLRIICGLEKPDTGKIIINGYDISALEPKDRNIAMVFQNYALYPHKTVYQNLSLSLKLLKIDKLDIEKKVKEVSRKLRIEDLLHRKPGSLSGGEMQRVAVGRALIKNPVLFLFDEPFSNLDASLRITLRDELRNLHKELGVTMVYVTHDQTEAMSLGDKVVIIKDGIIQQIGKPEKIYNEPENIFVAEFIGHPKMNILDAKYINNDILVDENRIFKKFKISTSKLNFKIGIRPSDIVISDDGIKVEVESYDYQGSSWIVNTKLGNQNFSIELKDLPKKEESLYISMPYEKILLFDPDSGYLIK